MPTYEYVCTENGHPLEVFVRFGEAEPSECPTCGSPLRKVFHPAGILFKGSGFYKTDSRSAAKKADSKPADSKPSETKTSEKKSDESKPAASTPAKEKSA